MHNEFIGYSAAASEVCLLGTWKYWSPHVEVPGCKHLSMAKGFFRLYLPPPIVVLGGKMGYFATPVRLGTLALDSRRMPQV
jgi:hypothetical protein